MSYSPSRSSGTRRHEKIGDEWHTEVYCDVCFSTEIPSIWCPICAFACCPWLGIISVVHFTIAKTAQGLDITSTLTNDRQTLV